MLFTHPLQRRTSNLLVCLMAFTNASKLAAMPDFVCPMHERVSEPSARTSHTITTLKYRSHFQAARRRRTAHGPAKNPSQATSSLHSPSSGVLPRYTQAHTRTTQCTTAIRLALPQAAHQHQRRHKRPAAAVGSGEAKLPRHHRQREAR